MNREEFVTRLLDLGRPHGEVPVYCGPDWEALDDVDPRRFASVVRAAECWWLDSEPEAVRRRLADDDWLVRYRVRQAGLDVLEAIDDWPRVLDVVTARRDGYRPLERTPKPWTAEQLDSSTWREAGRRSPNVPPPLRFGAHVNARPAS